MSLTHSRPLLGCIADDFTGATDLANMLVRGGMRTVQSIGIPSAEMAAGLDADAIVIALKSRTTPSADAVAESLPRWNGCVSAVVNRSSSNTARPSTRPPLATSARSAKRCWNNWAATSPWRARHSRKTAAPFSVVTCSCRTSCSANRACRITR